MYNISFMKEPYEVMMKGKWEAAEDFFDRTAFSIVCPMTVAKDTAFHIAVHNKDTKPLKRLLERVDRPMQADVFTTNAYGNTVLHEAAINCNIAAVKLLVAEGYVTQEQLLKRNRSGQTPLFKAASFGSTKVVKYLASQPNQVTDDNKLHEAHGTRNDKTSILHAAVRGQHFGTAIKLLNLDEGLAELKTKNGMTNLCLLTNIQTTFSSKYRMQFWHRLVYLCIPTCDYYNDDAENMDDEPVQLGDNQSKDA